MYISNEQTSTIVVTNGEEIRAGSFFISATSIGSDVPTNFATKIPSNNVPLTNNEIDTLATNHSPPTNATPLLRSAPSKPIIPTYISNKNQRAANTQTINPVTKATRISFHKILK